MTVSLDDIDFDSILFEPLESVKTDTPPEEPPKRRRGRPLRTRAKADLDAPPQPRGRPAGEAKLKDLASSLADPMTKLGMAISFASPTAGAVMVARAEVTTLSLVRYAADKPRMLAALTKVSKVGPGSEIVETLAMVIIAVQLDIGKMTPDNPIGKLTGVSAIHLDLLGHRQAVEAEMHEMGMPDFGMTPPPGWDPRMMGDPTNPMFSFAAKPGAQVRN